MSSVDYLFWDPSKCQVDRDEVVNSLLESMDARIDEPPVPLIKQLCDVIESRFGPDWESGPCSGDHEAFGPALYLSFRIYGDRDFDLAEEILAISLSLGLSYECVS